MPRTNQPRGARQDYLYRALIVATFWSVVCFARSYSWRMTDADMAMQPDVPALRRAVSRAMLVFFAAAVTMRSPLPLGSCDV